MSKKEKLEEQLMIELKNLARVNEFPYKDAKVLGELLSAYDMGNPSLVTLTMMGSMDTLEKYPELYNNWDDVMIKYHTLGLFPNWNVNIDSHDIDDSNTFISCNDKDGINNIQSTQTTTKELYKVIENICYNSQKTYSDTLLDLLNKYGIDDFEITNEEDGIARREYYKACCNDVEHYIETKFPDSLTSFNKYLNDPGLCYKNDYDKKQIKTRIDNHGFSAGILYDICITLLTDKPLEKYNASLLDQLQENIMSSSKEKIENDLLDKDDATGEDDEYVDILAKHILAEKMAVGKNKSLKKTVLFLCILLFAASCFGVYEFQQIKVLKEDSRSEIDYAKEQTDNIIDTASTLLNKYSSDFAYASDPMDYKYHKFYCPKLTDHYYYDTIQNWKSRGFKKCKYCYAKDWDEYLAISLDDE